MMEQSKTDKTGFVCSGGNKYVSQFINNVGDVYIGLDVGSTSSDVVILDKNSNILFCDYHRTHGKPVETVYSQLLEISKLINVSRVAIFAATGSAGRYISELLDNPFVNEIPAQARAINLLYPQLEQATIIEMGGQDSKLIFLAKDSKNGLGYVRDFAINTVCAAGTGSFLDQQAQRLGVNIENEFGQLALQSKTVPRIAGRCSVFAKSDMIHLQQQATSTTDIIAGLCMALARNLKGNLGCGREFVKPIVFTGGVAANAGVVKAIEQAFELPPGGLVVPQLHFFTGAIGAVLVSKEKSGSGKAVAFNIQKLSEHLLNKDNALKNTPRRQPLRVPSFPPPQSRVYEELLEDVHEPIEAYLGVDVGSISTNVVVIDAHKNMLAKAYLMTAGKPLEAIQKGLEMVAPIVAGKVKIFGAATTGSGRYLTGDFIGADLVINEITAQAVGAFIVNPKVDTIFEIGGQDSKYISLENGVVVDFEMNHACAAGTGSFLEEQAQRLGININKEFANLALKSASPIKLGERCTVFIESDLLNYQQQGAQTTDLVAGLSYSIASNYLNRVVGRRRVGNNICFQGGTAFNKAVWSAFENITGKKIMVPDHHEVTGALGAAAIIADQMKAEQAQGQICESKFRGFENLMTLEYTVESFVCEHCPNNCEIKKVQLPNAEPLFYGSRCDRYNLKKQKNRTTQTDAFKYRTMKMLEFAGLNFPKADKNTDKIKIGIPLALVNHQLLPLFSQFFKTLGFEVVLSKPTDKEIIRKSVELITAQPCFPVKVAYGHVADLIEKGVDYIFIPSIVSMIPAFPENEHNQLCPYVQSLVYQIKSAFADKLGNSKILTAPMHLGEGQKFIAKSFYELAKQLGVKKTTVKDAVKKAFAAQEGFENALRQKGKEILKDTKPDEKLFVLVSRPYNGCDDALNLQLPKKLAELGVKIIPMDMLTLSNARLTDINLHKNVYWSNGQKILRAAEIIRDDPRLFAIYLSNFSCGPDSFLLTFFKDLMSPKPCLQLELDEHSADAGIITRLEAFLESLKHYHKGEKIRKAESIKHSPHHFFAGRKIYIPYMSDCSYGLAACLSSYGQPAEVMPLADEISLLKGRQFTTGKECLPCAITAGDMLKVLSSKDFSPDKTAFLMPSASGPCRFGMYNCLHKLILRYSGDGAIPVISPNQDSKFYEEFAKTLNYPSVTRFMMDIWISSVGIDLLHKVLLKLRPFAKEPAQIQKLYENSLSRWLESIQQHTSFSGKCKLIESIAAEFEKIDFDYLVRKPRIGIVGEIYVRSHPVANDHIVDRLEKLGAACDLASLSEWVYYTNFARKFKAARRRECKNFISNIFLDCIQHSIERKLAKSLEKKFGPLAEGYTKEVIKLGDRYLHHSFEGEAILSIGKSVEYHHHGMGGVVNVMPFSCMPSTIVCSHTQQLSRDCSNMPILNLSFDGQEDSTLTTRLEAFVEQVRNRPNSLIGISDILNGSSRHLHKPTVESEKIEVQVS